MLQPINVYTYFLINEVIPFDTKISSLIKKKLFNNQGLFFRSLICDFLNKIPIDIKEEEVVKYCKEVIYRKDGINNIAVKLQKYYLKMLKKTYSGILKNLSQNEIADLNYLIDNKEDYIEAIKFIENFLKIKTFLPPAVPNIQKHSFDEIYTQEKMAILDVLEKSRVALKYFDNFYKNEYKRPEENKNILTSIDYLALSINHELWNFLTHISYAYYIFETPTIFISNIKKGIAHLNRAILDIYDGLVMETCSELKTSPEYLNLRMLKLESLGDSDKIILLANQLKEHYTSRCK